MTARSLSIPIIRTKLNRPRLTKDLVRRDAVHAALDERGQQSLILVSAPAGYGKSIFVSQWLESRAGRAAWLSLDESDSDLRTFLGYVVAAVQTVVADACSDTMAQLEASVLAPLPILAGYLSNDFDELEELLVLVLDDYHRVTDPAVHELLNHLLKHPPAGLQLVVISRYDPSLALGALRAHNKVTEVRVHDLMFTVAQTGAFLEQATGKRFSSAAVERLHEVSEGWVAGFRLVTLAAMHHPDPEAFLLNVDGRIRNIKEYLVGEVLSHQPPAMVDSLCITSILNRFCAPLCEAVAADEDGRDAVHIDGSAFLGLLEDSGLFCVALDESGEWYRYHHLFQDLLGRQLKARRTQAEIAALHRRAAAWFEAQGFLEEAIHHIQHADGPAEVGRLIVRHRTEILNQEQWYRLDLWLQLLSAKIIEADPELMMLQAWRLLNQGRGPEAYSLLDRIEAIIGPGPWSGATEHLRGSVDALRTQQRYEEGQWDLVIRLAEQALQRLPPERASERAFTCFIKGGALQMGGDLEGARTFITDQLTDTAPLAGIYRTRLEASLCFVNWMAADLPSLRFGADRYLELAETFGLAESIAIAGYFLGILEYQLNCLSQAETSLLSVVSERRVPNLDYYTESAFALASVYQAGGREVKARETVHSVCEHLLGVGNDTLLRRAQAYEADLAMRQGRITDALGWARRFDPEPFEASPRFFEPRLTLARVLIAEGEKPSLERAGVLLQRLEAFFTEIHNIRFLIEVFALQALLHAQKGEEPAALSALGRAVQLAQPSGFIRLFVDLGPGLVALLNRLDLDAQGLAYVGQMLSAFSGDGKTSMDKALAQSLTRREVEFLNLLAEGLTNKEIADQLCISVSTVKRHTENIYQKLDVHGRLKAVAKALELSIIHAG